ncbi:protein of unknown function [Cupriavidus taiwanensis]|nr:protein of unknown function [Cupriavidus taiwanensis]
MHCQTTNTSHPAQRNSIATRSSLS